MRAKLISATFLAWFSTLGVLFAVSNFSAQAAAAMNLEVQLLWGTNEPKSPDSKHKEVEPAVKEKLQKLPLKWNNYFQVNSQPFSLKLGATNKLSLSEKCAIEVKNIDGTTVEVSLFGKGEQVMTRSQALPKGEILILGGNAPNKTSWLVVLKRMQ